MGNKAYLTIILMILLCQTTWSQKLYHPGYVVLNSKDTIYGEIQDRDVRRARLFEKIKFKSENGKRKKYTAYDLVSYSINNAIFESMWLDEDAEFFKFSYAHKQGTGEKVFLRLIRKGKVSLYSREFTDFDCSNIDAFELLLKQGDRHFQRANQGIFGLKKKKLSTYFKDCPSLVSNLNNKKFKYVFELADFYNNKCE